MKKMTSPNTLLLTCCAVGVLSAVNPVWAATEITNCVQVAGVTEKDWNEGNNKACAKVVVLTRSVGVGSRLWVDLDKNGRQDAGEPGIPGATVTLLNPDGSPAIDLAGHEVQSQLSGANGEYFFGNLRDGDYVVRVTPPEGYSPTVGNGDPDNDDGSDSNGTESSSGSVSSLPITLAWGEEPDNDGDDDRSTNLTVGFGFIPKAGVVFLGDYIWEDANANGVQDADESGLAGMTVSLTGNDGISPVNDVNGEPVKPVVTDDNGRYQFNDLVPGEYSIIVTPPEKGYKLSPGGDDPDDNDSDTDSNCRAVDGVNQTPVFQLPMPDGQRYNATIDCGFYRPVGVGSRIWLDLDADGRQDAGEPGIPGATVTLLNPDGSPATDLAGHEVQSQLSGANGEYFFGDLHDGDYVVRVTPPEGYLPTIDNGDPDNDDGSDSNGTQFSSGSVLSAPITLVWGEEPDDDGDDDRSTNLTVGFGFIPRAGVQIPTASSWTLGLLSLLLSAAAFWRRRRDS